MLECYKNMRPEDTLGSEVYMPFWTKKKGCSGLRFQRESRKFVVDEKEQTWWANSCWAHPETVKHRRKFNKQVSPFFFQGHAKVMFLNFKQVFLPEFLQQVRRRVKVSFWVLCFLISSLKSVSQEAHFWMAKLSPLRGKISNPTALSTKENLGALRILYNWRIHASGTPGHTKRHFCQRTHLSCHLSSGLALLIHYEVSTAVRSLGLHLFMFL